MPQEVYGFPEAIAKLWPDEREGLDFYVLSNEDIGFIANLVAGTNDVFSFALPYPSSIDLFDETIKVWAIEFIHNDPHQANVATFHGLLAYMSMLDKEFAATFLGNGSDSEDENLKAHFAGNIYFGNNKMSVTATAAVEGMERHMDMMQQAIYFPPVPLDLVTPLYIQLVNMNVTVALATNVPTAANFTEFEKVMLRVWFTRRKLTSSEKSARAMQINWQRLDS
jgi:hypothetical protein